MPAGVIQQSGEIFSNSLERLVFEVGRPVPAIEVISVDAVGYLVFHVQGRQEYSANLVGLAAVTCCFSSLCALHIVCLANSIHTSIGRICVALDEFVCLIWLFAQLTTDNVLV